MNPGETEISLNGTPALLLPERAVFLPTQAALLAADVHLGKAHHFRKNGIPVPSAGDADNIGRLEALIANKQARKVYFLGDLFHSAPNATDPEFSEFLERHPHVQFTLVLGNHDMNPLRTFAEPLLRTAAAEETEGCLLTHFRTEHPHLFNLSGHVHPAVRLRGAGKQQIKVPCFHFDFKRRFGVLPSFGDFTGSHVIRPEKDTSVYVVADNKVIDVN